MRAHGIALTIDIRADNGGMANEECLMSRYSLQIFREKLLTARMAAVNDISKI